MVFALMLLAVSVGLKFFDARRKKQVVDMLHTASGEPVVTVGNLLKEIENEKPTGFKRLLNSLQFSKHALQRLQRRGIELDGATMKRLHEGVSRAAGKGSRDSLVLVDNTAFVVSVRNHTVITAVGSEHMKDNVFTNIDSAVIA